ncbi:MAG: DMT family transporter [Rhodobacteraceae bacterium]|nr:DMT family transporter [Paracoccaceae bacterium]
MEPKNSVDATGAVALIAFSALLGFNQVVIKFTNEGLQPVFWAGLRSAIAAICVAAWILFIGRRIRFAPGTALAGIIAGLIFGFEFLMLFLALDLTTVTRTSIIFYSMPVWLAIAAHFLIPGERLSAVRITGLVLSLVGVAWAILSRSDSAAEGSLTGDLCALAASIGWAGIPLCARITALKRVEPEMQLFWHTIVSAPFLLILAPLFGPAVRDFQSLHMLALMFQSVIVVAGGFMFWLHLLRRYPASTVASFSFLGPIFGVLFGWLLLGEQFGNDLIFSLVCVAAGIILINRPAQPADQ